MTALLQFGWILTNCSDHRAEFDIFRAFNILYIDLPPSELCDKIFTIR